MQAAIQRIAEGRGLSEELASAAAEAIIRGQASPAQIGGLLVGLRVRGESTDEVVGFARAMRDAAGRAQVRATDAVDSCGTGGDARGTFNISTVSAFVAAGAGCRVAKHGNRWISGRCGSADVLEALGVRVEVPFDVAARCVDEIGLGFLFAPLYHEGTRHAAGARREIGIRSLFNIVGPLCNPASVRRQLVGVFSRELTQLVGEALQRLGSERALIAHGDDGLDEISPCAETTLVELCPAGLQAHRVAPESLGVQRRRMEDLRGGDAQTNAEIARSVLGGERGAPRDAVLLNAGAVIYLGGRAATLADGVRRAGESIDSGAATHVLAQLIERTNAAGSTSA